MTWLTDEDLWQEIDLLVDTDPIKLRDVAWGLYRECKRLRWVLEEIAECPNPDSVEDCHNAMSDLAHTVLA